VVKELRMSIGETLEFDYLVKQVSGNAVSIDNTPSANDSSELKCISRETGVFNPAQSGTYHINVNNQTIKIEVIDVPETFVEDGTLNRFYSINSKSPGNATVEANSVILEGIDTGSDTGSNYAEIKTSDYLDKTNLSQVSIDFSLKQFGDSNANFVFYIFEGTFNQQDFIESFGNLGSKGDTERNLDRAVRTVDLSEVSGVGPLKLRAYRSSSGPVENLAVVLKYMTYNTREVLRWLILSSSRE